MAAGTPTPIPRNLIALGQRQEWKNWEVGLEAVPLSSPGLLGWQK